jgi:hypothetical protein
MTEALRAIHLADHLTRNSRRYYDADVPVSEADAAARSATGVKYFRGAVTQENMTEYWVSIYGCKFHWHSISPGEDGNPDALNATSGDSLTLQPDTAESDLTSPDVPSAPSAA